MTPCPVCQKPVDPLRAPAARVREGRVIAYCSKEHAELADTKPTVKLDAPEPRSIGSSTPAKGGSETKSTKTPAKGVPETKSTKTPAKGVPVSAKTPSSGIPTGLASLESGPVIEIVHEPATGVVTSAPDRRSGRSGQSDHAEADGAIQIAETGTADDYIGFDDEEPSRGRGLMIFLVLMLLVIGGAAGAYYLGYLDRFLPKDMRRSATVVVPTPAPVKPMIEAPIDADTGPTPSAIADRARDVLAKQLKAESPRIQRIAASALARTGDAAAITVLAQALDKETGDTAHAELAYALGRAGDKRGVEALVAGLASARRDAKIEAANRLALLGDQRAVPVLVDFLGYQQFRLGAAERLAPLQDAKALDVLAKINRDEAATPDDRARAAIALGFAGKKDVEPQLVKLLDDARFNAFAASALATLKNEAAYTVLVKQLEISALRVGAARALRKLMPDIDPTTLLPPLVQALDSKKDTEQVQAAEAILLLAGPLKWSEYE